MFRIIILIIIIVIIVSLRLYIPQTIPGTLCAASVSTAAHSSGDMHSGIGVRPNAVSLHCGRCWSVTGVPDHVPQRGDYAAGCHHFPGPYTRYVFGSKVDGLSNFDACRLLGDIVLTHRIERSCRT